MKTLADIKRRAVPGARLETVENTYNPALAGTRRTIRIKQTSAIASIIGEGDSQKRGDLFWTYWPKASQVEILDSDTFRLHLWGSQPDQYVTLRFL